MAGRRLVILSEPGSRVECESVPQGGGHRGRLLRSPTYSHIMAVTATPRAQCHAGAKEKVPKLASARSREEHAAYIR